MKIKVYTVEFKTPRWLKKTLAYGVVPAALLFGVGTAVRAAGTWTPRTFAQSSPISSSAMNSNFSEIAAYINGPNPVALATSATSATTAGSAAAATGALATTISGLQTSVTSLSQARNVFMFGTACVPSPYASTAAPSGGADGLWNPATGTATTAICPIVAHGNTVSNLILDIATNNAVTCTPFYWNGSGTVSGTPQSAAAGAFRDIQFNFGNYSAPSAPAQIVCTLPANAGLRWVKWTEN